MNIKTFKGTLETTRLASQGRFIPKKGDLYDLQMQGDIMHLKQYATGYRTATLKFRAIRNFYELQSVSAAGAIAQLQGIRRLYIRGKLV